MKHRIEKNLLLRSMRWTAALGAIGVCGCLAALCRPGSERYFRRNQLEPQGPVGFNQAPLDGLCGYGFFRCIHSRRQGHHHGQCR